MNKIILSSIILTHTIFADFSAQEALELEIKAAKIRKELHIATPTAKEKKLERIRHELKLDFDTSSKEKLLGTKRAKSVGTLTVSEDKGVLDSVKSVVKNVSDKLHFKKKKEDDSSFGNTLNSLYEIVGLEEGEHLGLPSVFGLNEKKKKRKSLFDISIFGDIKDTGNTIFKGMKYSGQSAEFSSGMIYKSSKMYNTMFGMFEESPFNVFEEKKETSLFDVFEGGNRILDMF